VGLETRIGPKSVIDPLLTLVFSHDGQSKDHAFFADFDLHCKNQLGRVGNVSPGIVHVGQVCSKYQDELAARIEALKDGNGGRYAAMSRMASSTVKVSTYGLLNYIANTFGINLATDNGSSLKIVDAVTECFEQDDHGVPETPWHSYSAVTRYLTHALGRSEAVRARKTLLSDNETLTRAFYYAVKLLGSP